jgi:hypothetical protein
VKVAVNVMIAACEGAAASSAKTMEIPSSTLMRFIPASF